MVQVVFLFSRSPGGFLYSVVFLFSHSPVGKNQTFVHVCNERSTNNFSRNYQTTGRPLSNTAVVKACGSTMAGVWAMLPLAQTIQGVGFLLCAQAPSE